MDRNSDCWYLNVCQDDCSKCVVYPQMKWQFDNSGLPKSKYMPINLYASDEDYPAFLELADIRTNIVEFVETGHNLYICSTIPGNGKTSWAIKMLQTYFHYVAEGNLFNVKGMFVSVPDLLLKSKDFDNPLSKEYKDNLRNCDLLILDDIAVTGLSQYDYLQLFTLIDYRMLANKSIIFTSNNVTLKDLQASVGERLASRIWNNSNKIELRGGDMRG